MCKCVICDKKYDKNDENIMDIGLNSNDGWCESSTLEYICKKCFLKNISQTREGDFLVIKNKMYFSEDGFSWELIRNQSDIDYIFNKEYYDISNKFQKLIK